MKKWLCNIASEFVEGLADGFLILFGGASVAQFSTELPRIPPVQALCSVLLAGVWYVASYIKKNPPPFGADSTQPSALSPQPTATPPTS